MKVFYNDNEPYVLEWTRNLLAAGLLRSGEVDGRSIAAIQGKEIADYRQCHFFHGIGGWPLALQLAGWPEDQPVWTGSCPCQPWSAAGKKQGYADPRNLWPEFYRLIAECRPATVLGEQVSSLPGRVWLAGIRSDLEKLGYRFGAADLPACCQGAPHIRQRLFWVAHSTGNRFQGGGQSTGTIAKRQTQRSGGRRPPLASETGSPGGMADSQCHASQSRWSATQPPEGSRATPAGAHAQSGRRRLPQQPAGLDSSPWAGAELLLCRDGKYRRVEPGLLCLVDGVPFRLADGRTVEDASQVGLLRGLGNAIVPQVAAVFIRAFLDSI